MESSNPKRLTDSEVRLKERALAGNFGASFQLEQLNEKINKLESAASRLGGNVYGPRQGGYTTIWNGEKNIGEMGPSKVYLIDYDVLRARSWQLYTESEVAKMIEGRFRVWTIGSGLKLQSEPVKDVLAPRGIKVDKEFSKRLEAMWKVWCSSKESDYSKQQNINLIAGEAFKNTKVGGDVLCLTRYRRKRLSLQLIDGAHVQTPPEKNILELYGTVLPAGERIVSGIHLSASNEHIGYYVKKDSIYPEYEYVPAYGKKSGLRMAWMVYGDRYRIDNHRGLPLLSVVAETIKKMERYKEAVIGSAEERQKIAYAINHKSYSTGANPLQRDTMNAFNVDFDPDSLPTDSAGNQIANNITASTNKQAFNMPIGAELGLLESKNELYFNDFYTMNLALIASGSGIPPEVLLSKYNSNYSASRGALKDWENSLNVNRYSFAFQFYGPLLEVFMNIFIMQGIIQAPGYLESYYKDDYLSLEAYRSCRWVGPSIPNIDPLKEVEAERAKLGPAGANLPLTTAEQATENLSGGDYAANAEQFAEELKESKILGIKPDPIETKPPVKPKP